MQLCAGLIIYWKLGIEAIVGLLIKNYDDTPIHSNCLKTRIFDIMAKWYLLKIK